MSILGIPFSQSALKVQPTLLTIPSFSVYLCVCVCVCLSVSGDVCVCVRNCIIECVLGGKDDVPSCIHVKRNP